MKQETSGDSRPLLLVVDGLAVAYRAFHAIQELSTADGRPTNALFGFIRMVRQLIAAWAPAYCIVAFDGGLPEERMALVPEYKAQRPPMPDALRSQLEAINEFLECAGVCAVRLEGEEADDVMATLCARAMRDGLRVAMATSDKDMYQIVSDSVIVVSPSKAGEAMGPEQVREKTGVGPERVLEWLALIGDSVDNIPGVPGVGPKTAARLLDRFDSIEALWSGLDRVESPKLREKLAAHRELVERNLRMMRLRSSIEGVPEWDRMIAPPPNNPRLVEFLNRYELRSLAREVAGGEASEPAAAKPSAPREVQGLLF